MMWNWFCPLPPAKTGIAEYAAKVIPSIATHAELTFWVDQLQWDPALQQYGNIRPYDPSFIVWPEINRADLNIYHIGNHPEFHGAIWQVARQCPGVIVLHDPSLHHLFGALYRERWNLRDDYLRIMHRYYGAESLEAAGAFFDRGLSTEFMAEHFPLTWYALERSLGVVVHSRKAFEELKSGHLPAAYIPLPYPPRTMTNAVAERRADDPARIILFGFLGRNRRLDVILRTIAGLPRRELVRLDICGEIDDAKETSALIRALGLEEAVKLHGFLSDTDLDDALSRAHLAINLRFPSMGEASFSQLRIWDHALPSIVTKIGWYATLPEDVVSLVRPEREAADLAKHLNDLLDEPQHFREMGRRGRKFLEDEHSPAAYAAALAEFVRPLAASRRPAAELLAERVGNIAHEWLSPGVESSLFENASRQIMTLAGET